MLNSVPPNSAPVYSCPICFLHLGSTGIDVIDLQQILRQRGFNPGAIDSSFGVRTHPAVYRCQFSQELSLSGGVDLETWQALGC
jgi:peptidoglycan hydrolase-like protein with peptidoglycan-binding domain